MWRSTAASSAAPANECLQSRQHLRSEGFLGVFLRLSQGWRPVQDCGEPHEAQKCLCPAGGSRRGG